MVTQRYNSMRKNSVTPIRRLKQIFLEKRILPFKANALRVTVAARDEETLIRLQNMTLNGIPLNFDFQATHGNV